MRKQARDHDDHIRAIDAWLRQLIDEVKLQLSVDPDTMEVETVKSALDFADQGRFNKQLEAHLAIIRPLMSQLSSRATQYSPEASELHVKVVKMLAAQNEHITELERLRLEVTDLDDRLTTATARYMLAEKKLDRARSQTIVKFEKGLLLSGAKEQKDEAAPSRRDETMTNGASDHEDAAGLEVELKKALAVNEQQRQQMAQLETENAELVAKNTEIATKAVVISDEDFAKTELFKRLKSQHDDVVRKLNDLEALNAQIKGEIEKAQAERTAYQAQVDTEARGAIAEKDAMLTQVSADLVRVRNHRDEVLADRDVKKAALDERSEILQKLKDLQSVHEDRIHALESENARLKTQAGSAPSDAQDLEAFTPDDLKAKIQQLDSMCTNWQAQLVSMENAYHKAQQLAKRNLADHQALEEKSAKFAAEKAKADQKYFATMRSKEAKELEVRTLRSQGSKSAEVISQLKEAEAASRSLIITMEKQLAEVKSALSTKVGEHRSIVSQSTAQASEIGRLKSQIEELKQLMTSKDNKLLNTSSACRQAEHEAEGLKTELSAVKKSLESWKSKSGQSEQYDYLRSMLYCTVCKKELKNTVIKTCGHTFCHDCVEKVVQIRSRKCPNCGKPFGASDYMRITL